MYRTCDGCKADRDLDSKYCSLRYRRKLVKIAKGVHVWSSPDEICPKPRTWNKYFNTPEREGPGRP